jgi:hypothetical protein
MSVDEILHQIDQLSESERLTLEQRLAERAEREWREAARQARLVARERGIDQATIDTTVDSLRYPR